MKRFPLLALFLAVTVLAACQPRQSAPAAPAALSHFSLVIERSAARWAAQCETGCAWTEVSMDCAGCDVRIDATGIAPASAAADPASSFAFEVQAEGAGWKARGIRGLAWKELEWTCASGSCRAVIDETGVRAPGTRGGPVAERAPLVRVAELPGEQGFEGACTVRLRDPSTGQEYQLVRSEVRTVGSETRGGTVTTLARAMGDYARLGASGAGMPVAEVRVDCTTSRVVSAVTSRE